jgi:hypothetical protein
MEKQTDIKTFFWFRGEEKNITYSDCVFVDLGIQHAMRMGRIMLSAVICLPLPHFSTLFRKRNYLRDKVIEY